MALWKSRAFQVNFETFLEYGGGGGGGEAETFLSLCFVLLVILFVLLWKIMFMLCKISHGKGNRRLLMCLEATTRRQMFVSMYFSFAHCRSHRPLEHFAGD